MNSKLNFVDNTDPGELLLADVPVPVSVEEDEGLSERLHLLGAEVLVRTIHLVSQLPKVIQIHATSEMLKQIEESSILSYSDWCIFKVIYILYFKSDV